MYSISFCETGRKFTILTVHLVFSSNMLSAFIHFECLFTDPTLFLNVLID